MAPDRGLPLLEPPTGRERSGRVGGATLLGILALISLRWLGAPHSSSPPQNVGLHPNEPAAGGGAATLGPAGAAVVTVQQAEPTRLAIAAEPPGSATARPNSKAGAPEPKKKYKYAFYMHVFGHATAVIHQLQRLRKFYPHNPVTILSDGGWDYSGLCEELGCTFVHCPPANDRWHPWPFLHRLRDAAIRMGAEYTIYLEPDNTIHGPITHEPQFDAGGMHDDNPAFSFRIVTFVAAQARRIPGKEAFRWDGYQKSGLAGGSYFRTAAIVDAFSDDHVDKINWAYLHEYDSARLHSSDFAMPIALIYRGYTYGPWKDIVQKDLRDQPNVTQFAFEHYGRGVEGGKPEYRQHLSESELRRFAKPIPPEFENEGTCSFCWDPDAYVRKWGADRAGQCANLHVVKCNKESYHHWKNEVVPRPPACWPSPDECRMVPYNRKTSKQLDVCREYVDNGTIPWSGLCMDGTRPPVLWCRTQQLCLTTVHLCDIWSPTNKSQRLQRV